MKKVMSILILLLMLNSAGFAMSSYSDLDTWLGADKGRIGAYAYDQLSKKYQKLLEAEQQGKIDEANQLWKEIERLYYGYLGNDQLGLLPPKRIIYKNMIDFYDKNRNIFSESDWLLLKEYEAKIEYYNKLGDSEQSQSYRALAIQLLSSYDYDYLEIFYQTHSKDELIALYDVQPDFTIKFKSINGIKPEKILPIQLKAHEAIWQKVKDLYPENYLAMITEFKIGSDGKGSVLAYTLRKNVSLDEWRLGVDFDDMAYYDSSLNGQYLNETLIHELAHIITLSTSQMKSTKDSFTTYKTVEGDLSVDAYLNRFVNLFWENHLKALNNIKNERDLERYYQSYQNEFVSRYAFTNPEEDIAESFRMFVSYEKPLGNTLADEKIRFFYRFEEMIQIRDYIRGQLKIR